jgi:hypothetical protein
MPNKKAQELLERKKNWIFSDPDSLLPGAREKEDPLNAGKDSKQQLRDKDAQDPDDDKNQELRDIRKVMKLSPVEEYYLTLVRQKDKTNGKDRDKSDLKKSDGQNKENNQEKDEDDQTVSSDPKLPESIRQHEQEIRKLLRSDNPISESSLAGMRPEIPDFFELGKTKDSPEEKLLRKAHMDEYRKLIGMPIAASSTSDLNPLNIGKELFRSNPNAAANINLPASSSPTWNSAPDPQLGIIPSTPMLPDLGTKMPSLPSFSSASLIPERQQPITVKPPTPTFLAPKRVF